MPHPDLQELLLSLGHHTSDLRVERARQVWANRDVNLGEIDAIGFDMDYTLALYNQEAMDQLASTLTLERLIRERGYPDDIQHLTYDPTFPMRGLILDKLHGNILKVDAGRHVVKAFHGYKPLDHLGHTTYHRDPIRLEPGRYHLIDTLFGLPEVGLFAALIDHFDQRGTPITDFQRLFDDIRASIDLAHRDGSLKAAILADLPRYLLRDPRLAPTLHKFRSAGKKLFLLTNSEHFYTEQVMSFLLDGLLPHYPTWRHYFDLTITLASKPRFFTHDAPFLELDPDGAPLPGPAAFPLRRHVIYQGGNLRDLEEHAHLGVGNRVLYIGDHIYGDLLKSKKTCAWKTCMVVQEMAAELDAADAIRAQLSHLRGLEREHHRLSEEIAFASHLQHHLEERARTSQNPADADTLRALQRASNTHRARRQDILTDLVALDRELEGHFNPYWGPIFLARNELSTFGSQVNLYADLYTSSLSNFLAWSPLQYFRAHRPLMPHEV